MKNKLRELLRKGRPTLGTAIFSPWPAVMEVIGATGVIDYVEFMSTYVPFDLHDLDALALAAERHGMGTMIKIDAEGRNFIAQR